MESSLSEQPDAGAEYRCVRPVFHPTAFLFGRMLFRWRITWLDKSLLSIAVGQSERTVHVNP